MFIRDAAKALSRDKTREGFLRVRARIGRAGIHDYRAGEIGAPGSPETTVRVFRPPDEVFDPASMASFDGVPVTLDHPPAMVDSANWKAVAVGHAVPTVVRDGDHLAADLLITDAAAVARADEGAELSNGYWADFDFTPGITPGGEAYDAVQRKIRGNHIALVESGRCGPSCRIDPVGAGSLPDAAPTRDTVTVVLDEVAFETSPEGARAIARLGAALDQARATGVREIAVRDGEIAALRTAAPDTATIDRLVAERAGVIEAARAILGPPFDGRGQTVDAIRRAAVTAVLGAGPTRSDDYVRAAFDALVAARPPANPLAAHLAAGGGQPGLAARALRDRDLAEAWKGARA